MANKKLKTIAKGCTLSVLVKDITSDRKHIRFFLTNSSKQHAMLGCEESITNKLKNKEITIKQLLECRYNPKTNMIQ